MLTCAGRECSRECSEDRDRSSLQTPGRPHVSALPQTPRWPPKLDIIEKHITELQKELGLLTGNVEAVETALQKLDRADDVRRLSQQLGDVQASQRKWMQEAVDWFEKRLEALERSSERTAELLPVSNSNGQLLKLAPVSELVGLEHRLEMLEKAEQHRPTALEALDKELSGLVIEIQDDDVDTKAHLQNAHTSNLQDEEHKQRHDAMFEEFAELRTWRMKVDARLQQMDALFKGERPLREETWQQLQKEDATFVQEPQDEQLGLEGQGLQFVLASCSAQQVHDESNLDDEEKRTDTMEVEKDDTTQDQVESQPSRVLSKAEVCQMALDFETHPIAANIWESAIFVNLSAVGTLGSVLLVIGILLNVLLQLTFVTVVARSFLSNDLPEVGDVWAWRELQGHQAGNMQLASRASLVRAICNDDQTLIISNYHQQLYKLITDYTDRELGFSSGFMLCTMILIQWVLIVGQECREIISYTSAVLNLPKYSWRTELTISQERITFSSCSITRRAFVLLLGAARFGIAAMLLITGCIWQAQTLDIKDLVLNSAALATVMSLDEVVFDSLMPSIVKTMVRETQPLRKPMRQVKAVAATTWLVSITIVVIMITQYVTPNIDRMDKVQAAICGGFKDFVFDQLPLNVIAVTGTRIPSGQSETKSFAQQAVWNMINNVDRIEDAGQIQEVLYLADHEEFDNARVSDLSTLVNFVTTQVLGTQCEDYNFGAVDTVSSFREAMWNLFKARSCADVIHHCSGDWRSVRMLCPATCGCNQLHSGLYKNGANHGCPKEACISTPAYSAQLASLPCIDYNISDLIQMTGWTDFVSQWVGTWARSQPRQADDFRQTGVELMTHGCGVFKYIPLRIKGMLCQSTSEFSSLNPYCPVSCGCVNKFAVDCPEQCLKDDSTWDSLPDENF